MQTARAALPPAAPQTALTALAAPTALQTGEATTLAAATHPALAATLAALQALKTAALAAATHPSLTPSAALQALKTAALLAAPHPALAATTRATTHPREAATLAAATHPALTATLAALQARETAALAATTHAALAALTPSAALQAPRAIIFLRGAAREGSAVALGTAAHTEGAPGRAAGVAALTRGFRAQAKGSPALVVAAAFRALAIAAVSLIGASPTPALAIAVSTALALAILIRASAATLAVALAAPFSAPALAASFAPRAIVIVLSQGGRSHAEARQPGGHEDVLPGTHRCLDPFSCCWRSDPRIAPPNPAHSQSSLQAAGQDRPKKKSPENSGLWGGERFR